MAYPHTPPVGGDHAPIWQNCGFYAEPIRPELGVHSLEHGAVWITFGPGLPPPQLERLQELARRQPYVLVSPWPEALTTPVVASAWERQLRLPSAADVRLEQFVASFAEGPQMPEPGAPCTGGEGSPD